MENSSMLYYILGINALIFILALAILLYLIQITQKKRVSITAVFFYTVIFLVIVGGIAFYKQIFSYVLVSMVFVYLLNPWVSWLERRHIARWVSILFVYIMFGGVLAFFTYRYFPELIKQGNSLLDLLRSEEIMATKQIMQIPFVHSINVFLGKIDAEIPMLNLTGSFHDAVENTKNFLGNLPMKIIDNYQMIIGTVSFVATIPLISFFLLKDGYKLRNDAMKLIPNRYFELCQIILHRLDETVGTYLRAMFYEVIVVSILASIVLTLLDVRNAILIAITAGVANIIPYFGPIMGVAVALLSILIYGGPLSMMINVIIGMYLVQVVDNNIIFPVVVGKTINMHPLLVLLTVLAGGWFGGILWMLLSVPLVYLVYRIVQVLHENLKKFKMI